MATIVVLINGQPPRPQTIELHYFFDSFLVYRSSNHLSHQEIRNMLVSEMLKPTLRINHFCPKIRFLVFVFKFEVFKFVFDCVIQYIK